MSELKPVFHAIVEVMGHKKYAGFVSEEVIGGASFVRVDVPKTAASEPFSKLFGAGSIYCITPVTEAVATAMAERCGERPVSVYDLPEDWQQKIHAKALPAPSSGRNYRDAIDQMEEEIADEEEDEDDPVDYGSHNEFDL